MADKRTEQRMNERQRRQDAKDEANWRDLQLVRNGLLDPGQPTETATVLHRRKIKAKLRNHG